MAGWRASWGRGGWPGVPGGVAGRLGGRREVLLTPVPRRPHAAPTPLAQLPRAVPSSSKEPILYVYIISNISLPLMPILMPASGTRLLHIALAVVKGQSGEGPLEVTGGHGTVAIAHYY